MSGFSHRKGTKTVCFKGADGQPFVNGEVTVKQLSGSVKFGCAGFESVQLVSGEMKDDEKPYIEARVGKMLEIFDLITLPFYWGRFEPERGKPDTVRVLNAAKWLKERGVVVKGHPLCWHTVCAPWLMDMSDEDILKTQLERIKRDVTDFAGVIDIWDVINEVVIMPVFDKYDNGVTRICKMEGRIGLVKKVFEEARRANPEAVLIINDFDMSTDYSDLITELLDKGIEIDVIGLQSHMHQGAWEDDFTYEVLERFSTFGLPLHFTEINMVSGDLMPKHIVDLNDFVVDKWPSTPEGEARQAELLTGFYKKLFDCKLVEAVTYWSFSDGGWLNAPAGLMTREARVKPAYDALYKLIKKDWLTPEFRVKTNENGHAEINGFLGTYIAEFGNDKMEFVLD
jgi:GH35 family endo-1,4-beta-xylanase